ncbi:IMPG2 protein, partial [Glaucidium brasilianum]|nr:IMPG2 protein [Glaucidium brasilianum]
QGPLSDPRPSLPPLGAGGRGGLLASTAQAAAGTGWGLPVPTAMASTPGVTPPSLGGALGPTTGVLGPPDTEGPPEHGHVPPDQSWHPPAMPGQPPASVAPGSPTAAQRGVPDPSPGPPRVPPSSQPAPTGGSVAPTSPTPQPSLGTSWGVLGLSPTAGTPPAGPSLGHQLPHTGLGSAPAESPQILGGTLVGVGDAGLWAAPLGPHSAPGPPQQLGPSQPASSLGLTTAGGVTTVTAGPALLRDMGTVTPEPGAAVLQGAATWGPPTLPTVVPEHPQQPPGTLGHRGGPGSPPDVGDTGLAQPWSSPRAWLDADTPRATPAPGRAPRVFIVEDQPPLLRATLLRIPCELVLDMGFVPALQDPGSRERRRLLHSFNQTVTPLFTSVPGFLRLEVTGIREGSVVLEYDALFAAERVQAPGLGELLEAALGSGGARPGLAMGTAPILRHAARGRPLDPCALLFACRPGFACVAGADGNATCTSLCHRDYCKNHGICTHPRDHGPLCQCPVGSDFWFMGLRCDYRVTQQSLLGVAAGVLLSIILLGTVIAAVAIRRFKALLLEARADQTRSSYRRFCRLDDVSAQYWSRSWLPSASSLDNPAFSNSEELLHLQMLDNGCCGCQGDSGITGSAKRHPALPAHPARRHSSRSEWDTSSSSVNDPMVDSGKASDISVSSWPMEPTPWAPFPLPQQLSRQRPHKAHRPRPSCEGLELVTLERSWTA